MDALFDILYSFFPESGYGAAGEVKCSFCRSDTGMLPKVLEQFLIFFGDFTEGVGTVLQSSKPNLQILEIGFGGLFFVSRF